MRMCVDRGSPSVWFDIELANGVWSIVMSIVRNYI